MRKARVLVSQSQCIFANLALEEYVFKTTDFRREDVLLVWRNRAAVVLGCHQNPWLEADVSAASRLKIDLARRRSGGGTVFHDLGNVCISFLTGNERHNRLANLELVRRVFAREFRLELAVNKKHDLLAPSEMKISGRGNPAVGEERYSHG
jgi:lipoyltransferase 1